MTEHDVGREAVQRRYTWSLSGSSMFGCVKPLRFDKWVTVVTYDTELRGNYSGFEELLMCVFPSVFLCH